MYFPGVLVGISLFAALALAHMQLDYPAPFNGTSNMNRNGPADPYLQYPYDCCGPNDRWQYPCRGYHKLLGTPEGNPTATWEAGSTANWNMSGIGNHYGGSCQVGFSTDHGETFRVATSYEGNCPHRDNGNGPDGQNFEFTVPYDIDTGVQIFAWIWYNREQELNMNCAAVNITPSTSPAAPPPPPPPASSNGASISASVAAPSATPYPRRDDHAFRDTAAASFVVAWNDHPLMFVADNGNDCLTPHTTAELKYPDPGPNVVPGDGLYPLALPSGSCSPTEMLAKQAYMGESGNDGH